MWGGFSKWADDVGTAFKVTLRDQGYGDVTADMVEKKTKEIGATIQKIQDVRVTLSDAGISASLVAGVVQRLFGRLVDVSSIKALDEQYNVLMEIQSDVKTELALAQAEVKRQLASSGEGTTKAARSLYDGAMKLIDNGKDDPGNRKADLDELNQQLDQAAQLSPSSKKTKVIAAIEAQLRKCFKEVGADKIGPRIAKDDPDKEQKLKVQDAHKQTVQDAYKKALEERFGITITIPDGFKNTNLDRVYEMFDKVPIDHVVHTQMQGCEFSNTSPGPNAGRFDVNTASIMMGKFDDRTDKGVFDPGDFSSVALHEIGHSVDARFNIVAKCQNDPRCGNWESVETETVVTMCIAHAKHVLGWATVGAQAEADFEKDVRICIKGDLPDQNKYVQNLAVLEFLLGIRASTVKSSPWMHDKLFLVLGGRCYIESYAGDWNSYAESSRTNQTSVSNYQWRAAGEWFAENYAFSWRNETPPPNQHPAIDEYMWRQQ